MSDYRALDPAKIIVTLERLELRIGERFPNSGLSRLCHAIADTARTAADKAAAIARPDFRLRILFGALVACGLAALLVMVLQLDYARGADSVYSVLQGVDSGFNIIVLVGAAVLGVARQEKASKRAKALKDLHELRSLMHIVDMHQLTKDPSVTTGHGPRTSSSPVRLTPFELTRYLDYCSEMLSLTAKIAALYAQSTSDDVVINTVNDLEQLAVNLSEKIWQKIALVREAANTPTPLDTAKVAV